jgi:hypothetical protein
MPFFTKNDKTIFFSHIPKTGGMSIERFFLKNDYKVTFLGSQISPCSLQHRHKDDIELKEELKKLNIIYSFTVIRNPIDRIVSEFVMHNSKNFTKDEIHKFIIDKINNYEKNNYISDNHIRPQVEFIHDNMDVFVFGEWDKLVNKLNEFDTFSDDFPHLNKGIGVSGYDWKISDKTKKIIESFYREDFLMYKKYNKMNKKLSDYNQNDFDTDKFSHQYVEFYEPIFEKYNNSKNILEIGIYNGESLKLLSTLFENSIIHGIDIQDKKSLNLNSNKIKTYVADQSNREHLQNIVESIEQEFDIIIDDGGHTMKQQQISFAYLFKHLKSGGVYILEDLHTSRITDREFITKDDSITTLDMLESYNDGLPIISNHMSNDEINYLNENIKHIDIWSYNEEKNRSVTSAIYKK